ncbi:helix-turn-helix domain-containing protein [Companilactobacillus ginsenosidimutans]|uniref:HTH cro/C1-type domain-containing protein n=1 Tax=Companilactobacillus ginsenosidimutans TaxID=1007676 RepID=A0A0H4QFM0_9LACO|nr:helix-turn-helix transcriptional regulator [Companilactobacillus ginsenosidimutans]AKP67209.1 hypothetical protein ABM34_06440 [Companilactobacillus ginsenosidimutans]
MTQTDELIQEMCDNDPNFLQMYNEDSVRVEIAIQIRTLRDSKKLSANEFAKKVNLPVSRIKDIESCNASVDIDELSKIANVFNHKLSIELEEL